MVRNLEAQFIAWSKAFHRAGHTQSEAGELIYIVIQICWARLFGRSVVEETEGYIETPRGEVAPALGAVAGLRRDRRDQAAFADHALELARYVNDHLQPADVAAADESAEGPPADRDALALLLDFAAEPKPAFDTALSGHSKTSAETEQRYWSGDTRPRRRPGLDPFYRQSRVLDPVRPLDNAAFAEIASLIAGD